MVYRLLYQLQQLFVIDGAGIAHVNEISPCFVLLKEARAASLFSKHERWLPRASSDIATKSIQL